MLFEILGLLQNQYLLLTAVFAECSCYTASPCVLCLTQRLIRFSKYRGIYLVYLVRWFTCYIYAILNVCIWYCTDWVHYGKVNPFETARQRFWALNVWVFLRRVTWSLWGIVHVVNAKC